MIIIRKARYRYIQIFHKSAPNHQYIIRTCKQVQKSYLLLYHFIFVLSTFFTTPSPSNKYDSEAITVKLPIIGKVGYIANSPASIAGGTLSAGRIYDKVEDKFFVRVMFTTQSKVICKVEENSDGILEKEIQTQIEAAEEWLNK